MSVKSKILLIFAVSCILILVLGITYSRIVLIENLDNVDKQNIEKSIKQVAEFIEYDLKKLEVINYKYSLLDESYNNLISQDRKKISSNFAKGTFVGSQINFFAFYNKKFEPIEYLFYDLILDKKIEMPGSISAQLEKNKNLLNLTQSNKKFKTIFDSPLGPIMISALPILKNTKKDEVWGTLIIGKIIDEMILEDYRNVTATDFDFIEISTLDQSEKDMLESGEIITSFSEDENNIKSKIKIGSKFPNHLFINVNSYRSNYFEGIEFVRNFILILALSFFLFFILSYLFIDLLVLKRLQILTNKVSAIRNNPNSNHWISLKGNDELNLLADETNQLLSDLDETNKKRSVELKEKQKIEEQLLENELYLKRILNMVPHAIYAKDIEGRFVFVNEALANLYGMDTREIEGYQQSELHKKLNMDEPSQQCELDKIVIEKFKSCSEPEEHFIDAFGAKWIFETEKFPFEYKGIKVALGISVDYTQRYWVEKKIEQSEEKFRTLIELANEGIAIVQNKQIKYNNPKLSAMLGYSSQELSELGFPDLVPKKDLKTIYERYDKKLAGFESIDNYVGHLYTKKSDTIPVEMDSISFNYNGKPALMVFVSDITERLNQEKELRSNEQLYRSIFELTSSGILIEDMEGNILEVNDQFCKDLGYSRSELIGKNILLFIDESYKSSIKDNIKNLKVGVHHHLKTVNVTKTGDRRVFEINEILVPLPDGQQGILVTTNDITEQDKIDTQLKLAKESAENANKLKAEFLALVSHEIRTPINTILSFSSLIEADLQDQVNEELKSSFGGITNAGKRIIRTIDLILNMSELQIGIYDFQPKAIDLYTTILDRIIIEKSIDATIKGIKFSLVKETDNLYIIADEYSVTQIFDNLLENAIKYTSEGEVRIVCLRDQQERLVVKVMDTGIGISKKYLKNLFQPFSQEIEGYTRPFEGNGLGLALVKNYCSLNKINIEVDSKKGEGSIFSIIFPLPE